MVVTCVFSRSHRNYWYIARIHMIYIKRSLHFWLCYDDKMFSFSAIGNVPLCLNYYYDTKVGIGCFLSVRFIWICKVWDEILFHYREVDSEWWIIRINHHNFNYRNPFPYTFYQRTKIPYSHSHFSFYLNLSTMLTFRLFFFPICKWYHYFCFLVFCW